MVFKDEIRYIPKLPAGKWKCMSKQLNLIDVTK